MAAVNLISDTQTRPTEGMRTAMAGAEVGDEQKLDDPTTSALQERVAELLGHEAALFLPSGTMCNLISCKLHVGPAGEEIILAANSHVASFEGGRRRRDHPRDDASDRRAHGHLQRRPGGGGGKAGGRPLLAGLGDGLRGADDEHGRRPGVAARSVREVLEVARATVCGRTWTARV